MDALWDYLLLICTIWFMITFILGRIRWTKGKSKSERQFEHYDIDKHWY